MPRKNLSIPPSTTHAASCAAQPPASDQASATSTLLFNALQRDVLQGAASWFNENDPEAERFYPGYKLEEMAAGGLQVKYPDGLAKSRAELQSLVNDALAWRAHNAQANPCA